MIKLNAMQAIKAIEKWQEQETKRIRKAKLSALKVTSFQLVKEARNALFGGRLGLQPLSPLTNIARGLRFGRVQAPLSKLWRGIGYKVNNDESNDVGFVLADRGGAWQRRYAEKMLSPQTMPIGRWLRRRAAGRGIFIRKETIGHVPVRDIIGQVKAKYGPKYAARLKSNFERKLRGEYI